MDGAGKHADTPSGERGNTGTYPQSNFGKNQSRTLEKLREETQRNHPEGNKSYPLIDKENELRGMMKQLSGMNRVPSGATHG